MERAGVPIDVVSLNAIRTNWKRIKRDLIAAVDTDFAVYDGTTFKTDRFIGYCQRQRIPWPKLPSGRPALSADVFRDMAKAWPQLHPLHELRVTLDEMRLSRLEVGQDGRNRCLLSPFRTITGRNAPSNTKFIFGPARWIRHLIKPPEGYGLAYLDWQAQELAISAALSGDPAMIHAYASGDPYLGFAVAAGLAPHDATKTSHTALREKCKVVCLGVTYGMEAHGLAQTLGVSQAEGAELLRLHRETYRRFWQWSDAQVDRASLSGEMRTCFGWQLRCGQDPNHRSLANWPVQSHGAEMMRLAAIAATEAGLEVCAPVHDAMLMAAPLERLEADAGQMVSLMGRAALAVTSGLPVRVDTAFVRWPDRYTDSRGAKLWQRVTQLISELPDLPTEGEQLVMDLTQPSPGECNDEHV
jgi:hypothetical protein